MGKKICKECLEDKPLKRFSKSKNTLDGYEGKCKDCRQNARKKFCKKCVMCGSSFFTAKKGTKCCSYECIGALRTKTYTTETICGTCRNPYRIELSAVRANNYCSLECLSKSVSVRMKGANKERVIVSCTYCGKDFERIKSHIKKIKRPFCDMECFSKGIGIFRRDVNLSDDVRMLKRSYPEYREWRVSVFERDEYTCRKCCVVGKELNAHHIYNYSSHPDLRTDVSNGITLCADCHIDFHVSYGYTGNDLNQLNEYLSSPEGWVFHE